MEFVKGSEWRRWDLHVHTASSYDAKYKGDDADQLLCNALLENNIVAVAITDHFQIDYKRIANLRRLAPDITFFPGVELRTDKGSKNGNMHLILIFSEEKDVKTLSENFDVIMLRQKAKDSDSVDRIHWTFEDIISFAKEQHALVSIHAGKKTNGIDLEITNALHVNEAIKGDIAKSIDFFEVGIVSDINDYRSHVFKAIDEKPIIMCSDCHNPQRYTPTEKLWIKANPTFEGLLQCTYQPKERIFVGILPPSLDREQKNSRSNIARITTKRINNPKNNIYNWFDFDLQLNSGLVAIIGNKGSGKSALADILGHLCKCTTMGSASFLNENRFRKSPKNYADDYEAGITWGDSYKESMPLSKFDYETTIENAQYLPQKYIEDVCNDIENIFQDEIDKVIFSYVDRTERGTAKNLAELVKNKSSAIGLTIKKAQMDLDSINGDIIQLEERKTTQYHTHVKDSLKKLKETLERHIKARPAEIQKPVTKDDNQEYQTKIQKINEKISGLEQKIADTRSRLATTNESIDDTDQLITKIEVLESNVSEMNGLIRKFIEKHKLDTIAEIPIHTPKEVLQGYLKNLIETKDALQILLNGSSDVSDKEREAIGLLSELEKAEIEKTEIVSTSDVEEKAYQKYLSDLKAWESEKKTIEGDSTTEDTIVYFETELLYINESLEVAYAELRKQRELRVDELFKMTQRLTAVYRDIYRPIEAEICSLLGDLGENISFEAEIQMIDNSLADSLLGNINKNYTGIFKGKTESQNKMNQLIRKTEFNKIDSIISFISEVMNVVDEDIDNSSKKIIDKSVFYKQLHALDYVGVAFSLKVGSRNLDELSPGERGIVLLIFYLALNKNSMPIIIDQPEDNLDNQSVYSKLVPCICAAKTKRQVIIVTHNPNIAIACDAEQIIYCDIEKTTNSIKYESGAIEDPAIKKHVVDVLEGTMPAFDLRKRKYFKAL